MGKNLLCNGPQPLGNKKKKYESCVFYRVKNDDAIRYFQNYTHRVIIIIITFYFMIYVDIDVSIVVVWYV
jgi:hypothetical protein